MRVRGIPEAKSARLFSIVTHRLQDVKNFFFAETCEISSSSSRERKKKPYQSYRIASRLVNRDRVLSVRDESERERWKIRAPSEPVGRRGITRCNGNQAQPLTADWVYTNHRPPMEAIILICWPSIEPRSPPRSRIIKVARRRERERE